VEFALTAPLLFFIMFASLEFARVNMLRNTVEMAAYEGARRGIVPGATAEEVRDAARFPLDTIFVHDAKIEVEPAVITDSTRTVTVTVAVPLNENLWEPALFFQDKTVSNSLTMPRERYDMVGATTANDPPPSTGTGSDDGGSSDDGGGTGDDGGSTGDDGGGGGGGWGGWSWWDWW
jgi:Flp pilus assembly protein TadG